MIIESSQENVDGVIPTYNSLLLYYDGPEQWEAAYKTSLVRYLQSFLIWAWINQA